MQWDGHGDWRLRLHQLLTDYVRLLEAHPGLARSALVVWPNGPHYLDLVELILQLLTNAGVPAGRAAWGVDVLLQLATAMAAEYGTRGERDDQGVADLAATLHTATPDRHPILTGLGAARMLGGERGTRRDWALNAAITGVAGTPLDGEQQG
jgi:hypothetical protein